MIDRGITWKRIICFFKKGHEWNKPVYGNPLKCHRCKRTVVSYMTMLGNE